jgi:hypothetical protein
MLENAYEYLRVAPLFAAGLPHADHVISGSGRQGRFGQGGRHRRARATRVQRMPFRPLVNSTDMLISTMAHEMIHLPG